MFERSIGRVTSLVVWVPFVQSERMKAQLLPSAAEDIPPDSYAVSVKLQVFVTNIPNSFSQQSNVVLFCSKPSSKGNSNSAIQRVFTFIISP